MSHVTVGFKASFPHKHLKKGKHTFLLPVEPDVERLIGAVVAYWGAYEVRMNSLIWEFAKAMHKTLDRDWERQEFRRRKETFKTLAVEYARLMFPDWEKKLAQLADTSGDLHWRRNVVAHGLYEIQPIPTPEGRPSDYRITSTGVVKGQPRSIPIDEPTLTKLWHDISHLVGEIMLFVNHTGANATGSHLVFPDDDFLQGDSGEVRRLALSEIDRLAQRQRGN
jgi:hypothetical protein